MVNKEELERRSKKSSVRSKSQQEDRQSSTSIQISEDSRSSADTDHAAESFEDKDVHVPLTGVLSSYTNSKKVQQVGLSSSCQLIEICPSTSEELARPSQASSDWVVSGVHQQILKVLSQYIADHQVTMVGLRASALSSRSDPVPSSVSDEEEDVFSSVVQAMKTFPASEIVQFQGCMASQSSSDRVTDDHSGEFVENQDHVVVLSASQRFSDSSKLLIQAMKVLLPLARTASNVEVLMSGGTRCYSAVIAAMDAFPEEEELQETACSSFRRFTSESFYNISVSNGVQRVSLRACQNFPYNPISQAAALSCSAELTATIVQSKAVAAQGSEEGEWEERAMEEVEDMGSGWMEDCCTASELHAAEPAVQEAASWAIHNSLSHGAQVQPREDEQDDRTPVHRQLMAAMLLHSSSPSVFIAATSAIATLITNNNKMSCLLSSGGLHVNSVEMMKRHATSAEVSISACKMLKSLFHGRTASSDEMNMAMSQILTTMKVHNYHSEVQSAASEASSIFLCPDRSLRENGASVADPDMADVSSRVSKNQCVLEGAHTLFSEALNRFINRATIQQCGSQVSSSSADCSGAVDLLCQQGAIDTVLHTLLMFPKDREMHYWGLTSLNYLVTKKKFSRMIVPVLASVVVASLRQYRQDSEMVMKCFQVASRMMDACSGAAGELQREDFDRHIFQHLLQESEQSVSPSRKVACSGLSKMWCDTELHYSMSEKACMDGNTTMAECLIESGAYINRKTNTDSSIYQVCEKGGPSESVEISSSRGPPEQQLRRASAVSVRRGDGPIVISSLSRLGLDLNNSALCLGGLRLGRSDAAWSSPLSAEQSSAYTLHYSSKGVSLARYIQSSQRSKGISGFSRSMSDQCLTSGYISDESDDSSFSALSMDDSLFMNEDAESDVSDSVSGTLSPKSKNNSAEESRGDSFKRKQGRQRHSSAESPQAENENGEPILKRYGRRNSKSVLGSAENSAALSKEKERIRSLDLSGNELDTLSCFSDDSLVQQQLLHVLRSDSGSNSSQEFPSAICQSLRSSTRSDLQGNQLQSLPDESSVSPSSSTLNVSRNCIGPVLSFDPAIRCPGSRQLNSSFNKITTFPYESGSIMENSEESLMEGNTLTESSSALCLPELKVSEVSKNNVENISPDFSTSCLKSETFNASMNKICSLSQSPAKVTTLKSANNKFTQIPEAISNLPNLRSVDMRTNSIDVSPGPQCWASHNIRELMFSQNCIRGLDSSGPISKWARSEKLHLSDNKLREIPPQIGMLEGSTSSDVSRNANSRSFPDEMGKLGRLWDSPSDGLRSDSDSKLIGNKTKDIVRFSQQRSKKAVPYHRMKLIVVGNSSCGKTTLVRQSMKSKPSQSNSRQSAVDVFDWTIKERDKKKMLSNVWDFSGGEELTGSHPLFLTSRALYSVVYNLSKGASQVDASKPWLFNIKAVAPSSPVILVGTHTDVSEELQLQSCSGKIREESSNHQSFPAIKDYHMVSLCEDSESIGKLRKAIIREVTSFRIQGQQVMGQLVPDSYVESERRILQERSRVPAEFPVLRYNKLSQLIQESQSQSEEAELPHAIHFLSEVGILLHFDDPALQLRELYFIDPQWLCNISSQKSTLKSCGSLEQPKGVVQRSVVERFSLETKCFPKSHMVQFFKLLEKFQIALPFGEDQLLVPSSLSKHRPVIESPHCENSEMIVRSYEMPYFPMDFWSRQISRLLEVSSYLLCGREKVVRPNRIYWRRGIYSNWSSEAYCSMEATSEEQNPSSFVRITVPSSRKGRVLLGQVVDHVDSVFEEWFPGSLNTDMHGNGEALLKKWALYSFEDGQEWSKISSEDLFRHFNDDFLSVNPENPRCTLPISQIAPDSLLDDQPAGTSLDNEESEIDLSKEHRLGDGGFGTVYRGIYKNEDVAVKIFNKHASDLYVHRLLRQESAVSGRLRHPSLVGSSAASSTPQVSVMELALRGSSDSLFDQKNGSLNRKSKHRIASHVADGLRYLHSAMIIYRDSKPHNVLSFNSKADSETIAKITDYGIAQYCCSMGVRSSEGTPGFRAPEVARGNVIYNQQADVFSFGSSLYDSSTSGERISDGMRFPSEFDEIAVQGKSPDPVKHYGCPPWPSFQASMMDCSKENPQDRPTSAQVFNRSNSGEILCLISESKVRSIFSARCITVSYRGGQKASSHAAWLGGGSSSKRKGFIRSVESQTNAVTQQEVDTSPVLCLATIQIPNEDSDWSVAGTQSGSLSVISTQDVSTWHHLQNVTDAVTSLYFHVLPRRIQRKNYLSVGTADGVLSVYEESVLMEENGQPVKTLTVGDVSTPLMCSGQSTHSLDNRSVWAGCGTKILSFSVEYDVCKSINTRPKLIFHQQRSPNSEACVSCMVVDKHVYVSKAGSPTVEVWDKRSEKMVDCIDCAQIIRRDSGCGCRRGGRADSPSEASPSWATVKAMMMQNTAALWIGTRGGYSLSSELSKHQTSQVMAPSCDSIRSITPAFIQGTNCKNVVSVLGRRLPRDKSRDDEESVSMVLNSMLPLEVKDSKKHCERREQAAARMREQLHHA